MRALVIDEKAQERIKILMDFAERNPISMDHLLDMVNGKEPNVGDLPDFKVHLVDGYDVFYTLEEQLQGDGKVILVKHLSVRLLHAEEGKLPSPAAVKMIMNEFGIEDFSTCKIDYSISNNSIDLWEPQMSNP